MFKCIVAYDEKRGLGFNNHLPWNIPEDLKLFKNITINHSVLMGRKTFESIGKPLNHRVNYVLSSSKHEQDGVIMVRNLASFIELNKDTDEVIFVIGGASIYTQMIPYCQELYLSEIKGSYEVDTYLTQIDLSQFKLISVTEYHDFTHKVYERVSKI